MSDMSDAKDKPPVEFFSTGSPELDQALGMFQGLPFGRIVEIIGPKKSGKTTLALHAIAQVQALGKHAAFIGTSHTFDPAYAKAVGVDLESLIISQPSSLEEVLEIAQMLAKSGEVKIIVIDSLQHMESSDDSHAGLRARLVGQCLRSITAEIDKSGTCVVMTHECAPEKPYTTLGTPGHNALKFYATVRIDTRREYHISGPGPCRMVTGALYVVKVVKNRFAPVFTKAFVRIMDGRGIVAAEPAEPNEPKSSPTD